MKKLILSLCLALFAAINLFAADFVKDDIAYNILTENTVEVVSKSPDYSGSVVIPETVTYNSTTYSVTTIGMSAFYHCFGLTSVTIPNSVTTIGEGAFYHCLGLTSVTIPNSVTTIGKGAFESCRSLTSVTIPNSVTTIGEYAFLDCDGLTSITIPNSVITIGDGAFYDCNGLTSIVISNSVTTIEQETFKNCSNLTSVTIPNSVTTIGKGAFAECSGLTSLTIPDSVTTIGGNAFDCVNNIVYNGTATGSPWGAKCVNGYVDGYLVYSDATKTILCGCSAAATGETTIPNSVTTIGEEAFVRCTHLTSVTIGNSATTIGKGAFRMCFCLTSIDIPNSVTTIENYAFAECSGLTSLTIPDSVTTIGGNAFDCVNNIVYNGTATGSPWGAKCVNGYVDGFLVYSDATKTILCGCSSAATGEITIPNSVTTIGEEAFVRCTRLTSITCYALTPPEWGDFSVLINISLDAKVYVFASALTDYQNAEVWKSLRLFPIAADVTLMDGDNPIVIPTNQDVTITWPITDGTDTYTLTITKNDEVVCVLTFNANGQLTNIAFAAPSHNGAHQAPAATLTAQGYQFTVTGLNPGTAYDYSVTATDASGKTLAEHKGNFSTTGGTGLNTLPYEGKERIGSKYFHNGNIIIERNGVKYTSAGQKVK